MELYPADEESSQMDVPAIQDSKVQTMRIRNSMALGLGEPICIIYNHGRGNRSFRLD